MTTSFHRDPAEPTEATLEVTIAVEDYKNDVDQQLQACKKRAQLKGFRPGAIPMHLVKKMYGQTVLTEVIKDKAIEAANDYLSTHKLSPVLPPVYMPQEITCDVDTLTDLTFTYRLALPTDFDIAFTQDIKLAEYQISDEVSTERIDNIVASTRKEYGHWEPVDNISLDTHISGALSELPEELQEKEGITITCRVSSFPEDLQATFLTKQQGDTLLLPTQVLGGLGELPTWLAERLNKTTGNVVFSLDKLENLVPAELDEAFFQNLFENQETDELINSEATYRSHLKKLILERYQARARFRFETDLVDALVAAVSISFPENLLKSWLLSNKKTTEKKLEQDYQDHIDNLRRRFVLDKIAENHDCIITPEELYKTGQERLSNLFQHEITQNMVENFLQFNGGQHYHLIKESLLLAKLIPIAREKITLNVQTVSVDEFDDLPA